jgi:hypothetical protein
MYPELAVRRRATRILPSCDNLASKPFVFSRSCRPELGLMGMFALQAR